MKFENAEAALAHFFHEDMAPWFKTLLTNVAHAEVAALMPIASAGAQRIAAQIATADADPITFADTVAVLIRDTAIEAAATGIKVAGLSVLAAVTTAIAAHSASVALGGAPAPDLPRPIETEPATDQPAPAPASTDPEPAETEAAEPAASGGKRGRR